jgi:hypothetical protein
MRTTLHLVVVIAAAACSETPADEVLVHGLQNVTVATTRDGVTELPPGCTAESVTEHELVADVAPSAGKETIRATFVDGIAVYDAEHQLVARSPGYECEGSADELVMLEAGSAFGEATIALAVRQGGHHHDEVALTLFRLDPHVGLKAAFTASVEERDGDDVKKGAIWMLPNGLVYRRPGLSPATVWTFDPVGRIYTFAGRADGTRSAESEML